MSRKSSPAAVGSRLQELEDDSQTHNHFGYLYDSREEQLDVAVSFLQRGLERGDRVIYAVGDNTKAEMRQAMSAAGIPVEEVCDSGQLTLRKTRDMYLSNGELDEEGIFDTVDELLRETTDGGDYSGLRIAAEITGDALREVSVEEFMEYESRINRQVRDSDFFGLCQYDCTSIPPEVAQDVIRTHPLLASRSTVGPNAYYHPPSASHRSTAADVESKLEAHRSQVEMRRELHRRERGITTLIGATRDLLQADWPDAAELAVRTALEAAEYDAVGLWWYDAETDTFDLRNAARADSIAGSGQLTQFSELAWRAFVTTDVCRRSVDEDGAPADTPLRRVAAFPIPGKGALLVGTREAELDELCMRVGRAFSRTLRVAIERAEQERYLEDTHEDVSRLETVNELARELIRATTAASTREDIEQAFCEAVTDIDEFAFAWIGEVGPNAETVTPRSWAGAEQGFLTDVGDETRGHGPVFEAARSNDVTVVSAITDRGHSDTWREETLDRGFRSAASIPLVYDGISYGVMTIYATQLDAFDGLLESVLTEVGRFVGYMLNTAARETARQTSGARELEVELAASNFPLLELARKANCTLEADEILMKTDTDLLVVSELRDTDPALLVAAAETAVSIEAVDVVDVEGDTVLLDLSLPQPFVGATLANHGADLQSVTADPDAACLVIRAPDSVVGRTIVDAIADRYREPSLVAQRQLSKDPQRALTTEMRDRLTDRQREVATVAYRAGYFERPRRCTGEEVAEALDVSPQAFYQHVRRIQEAVFGTLVER